MRSGSSLSLGLVLATVAVTAHARHALAADGADEAGVNEDFAAYAVGSDGAPRWLPQTPDWRMQGESYVHSQPLRDGSCTWLTEASFSDVVFTVRFRIEPEGQGVRAAGMVFRSVSSEDQYYVHFDSRNTQVILVRQSRAEPWHELARVGGVPIETGVWHEGKVECLGDRITVSLNDERIAEATDATFAAGRLGLRAGQGHIAFERVRAEGTPQPPPEEWVFLPQSRPNDELDVPRLTAVERFPAVRGGGYFPVLLRLADGRLGAVVRGGAPHVGLAGRLDWVTSADGGRTWSAPTVIADSPVDDRNPSAGQMADGTIVVSYSEASTYAPDGSFDMSYGSYDMCYRLSEDGGSTWSDKLVLPRGPIRNGSPYGRTIVLPSGIALMPVYGGPDPDYSGPVAIPEGATSLVGILRSADNGRTWGDFTVVSGKHNEMSLLALSETHILAALRTESGRVDVADSEDGGRTFGAPRTVTRESQHPADLLRLPGGDLVLVYGNRLQPCGVEAVLSRDAGQTWDYTRRVLLAWDSPHSDCGYPSIVQLDDGTVVVAYYSVGVLADPGTGFAFALRFTEASLRGCMGL